MKGIGKILPTEVADAGAALEVDAEAVLQVLREVGRHDGELIFRRCHDAIMELLQEAEQGKRHLLAPARVVHRHSQNASYRHSLHALYRHSRHDNRGTVQGRREANKREEIGKPIKKEIMARREGVKKTREGC